MVYPFKGVHSELLFLPVMKENDGAVFIFPIDENWLSLDGYLHRVTN